MTIKPDTAKAYLEDPLKVISDAKNSVCTEPDIQLMIDECYKQLDPSYKELGSYQKLIFGWYMNAPKLLMSQNFLDEVIKPFINKVNRTLGWNLRTPEDFMK